MMTTSVILIYAVLSLVLGAVAAVYARAQDQRSAQKGSSIGICLLVALFWPALLFLMTVFAACGPRQR
jgi:ABC-type Na+ efflux pump permease subunit